MSSLITPQTLKGFRDALPAQEIRRRDLMAALETSFRAFGFEPIDTPALEYEEILLGKGGGESDKQIYRFTDNGERKVALRYDLTVPFARFSAQHREELPFPFKRYHMAKVWRGENPQKGRYREFFQCDFDIVGADSPDADAEILLMMVQSLELLGAGKVSIRLNHKGLLQLFLANLGLESQAPEILRTVDKRDKIGLEALKASLLELTDENQVSTILEFIAPAVSWKQALERAQNMVAGSEEILKRLREVVSRLESCGVLDRVTPDFGIARGLDYYTGVVYETFLTELPSLGSVCSGGRYDNLAQLYSKERLPGVGSSVGLDRLLTGLEELGLLAGSSRTADVLVMQSDSEPQDASWKTAAVLREGGIKTDLFTENKKVAVQYAYAEKKNIPVTVIPKGGQWLVKRLADGEQSLCSDAAALVKTAKRYL